MNKNFDSSNILRYLAIGIAVALLLCLNYCYLHDYTSSNSELINAYALKDEDMQKKRIPAVAGLFYPASRTQLIEAVDGYLQNATSAPSPRPRLMIVPHAGYEYSVPVAAAAYKKLLPYASEIKNVILVGPSHQVALQGVALSSASSFKTPLGHVYTDAGITNELANNKTFNINDKAHAQEHSLEVQLPFLQRVLKNFQIVPLVYGQADPEQIVKALQPYAQRDDTLVIFSADLSHYLDYDSAQMMDSHTIEMVETNQANLENHMSCGATGINTAVLLAKNLSLQPRLLDVANSADVGGRRDSVVGYASWVFDKKINEQELFKTPLEQEVANLKSFAKHHGSQLLKIAQISLEEAALHHKKFHPSRKDYQDILFNKGAAFVTLKQNNQLRGCIGSLIPNEAVALDIANNTYNAALEDARFQPLKPEELPLTKISISLLSDYERIRFDDEAGLLQQVVANVDGLVIRDGDRQGLFLPSVWQEIPDKQEFLNKLKIKAGMSPSYWSNKIKVYRFRVVEISADEN